MAPKNKGKKQASTTKNADSSIPLWGWPFIALIIAALIFAFVVMIYGLYWIIF